MKANPWKLIQQHYRTLRDHRTDEVRKRDWALFVGVPVLVFIACLLLDLHLPKGASTALLTTAGVLTAFFFGVMLQIAGRALEWADRQPPTGPETSWQAQFLQEIAANAGYAALISILAAAAFVGSLIASGSTALTILSSLGIALAIHLALMLSMVLTRVYALTVNRLTNARVGGPSGGNVTPLPERKTGT
jgi:hypothetical protein